MVANAFYPSSWMAEMVYEEENRTFSFDYTYIPYAEINPTEVEITDEDIEKFVSSDEARYETDPYRKVRYFVFDIVPSPEDSAAARENVMRFYDGLANPPKTDSLYVNQNSEIPFNFGYFTLEEYQHPIIAKFFDTDTTEAELGLGDIAGPYFENGAYKISKLIDTATIPDSVRVSQIVITFDDVQTQEAFNARFQLADSLFNAIDTMGANFEQIAFQYSTDEATKNLGGDMGYITKGELNDIYLDNNIFVTGEQDKVFMGFLNAGPNSVYYIMKITDYPQPTTQAIRLATIQKSLFISDQTDKSIYSKADFFAYQHNSGEDFMGVFESDTLSIPNVRKLTSERVLEDDFNFGEFRNARNIIASIYNNSEGYVSDVIRRDNKLVVLYIEKAFDGGVLDVEDARRLLEAEVLKEKQGDVIVERLGSYGTASEAAGKMSKPVGTIAEATFALQNLNGLNEPLVIATASGLDQGQTSKPIRGNEGVFVVQIKSVGAPAKTDDLLPYINQIKGRYARAFQRSPGSNGRVIDAILEGAEVEDKRLENQL
jgi:parvulin-like peptidyl-prolyl isomerase